MNLAEFTPSYAEGVLSTCLEYGLTVKQAGHVLWTLRQPSAHIKKAGLETLEAYLPDRGSTAENAASYGGRGAGAGLAASGLALAGLALSRGRGFRVNPARILGTATASRGAKAVLPWGRSLAEGVKSIKPKNALRFAGGATALGGLGGAGLGAHSELSRYINIDPTAMTGSSPNPTSGGAAQGGGGGSTEDPYRRRKFTWSTDGDSAAGSTAPGGSRPSEQVAAADRNIADLQRRIGETQDPVLKRSLSTQLDGLQKQREAAETTRKSWQDSEMARQRAVTEAMPQVQDQINRAQGMTTGYDQTKDTALGKLLAMIAGTPKDIGTQHAVRQGQLEKSLRELEASLNNPVYRP